MNIINIEHISKRFGDKFLFEDASFGVQEGDKIGIVGINGTGKSTLLQMIAGENEPDEGQIVRQNGKKTAYLLQSPCFEGCTTISDYAFAGDTDGEWKVQSNLTKLGIFDYMAELNTLSGCQKRKVALAKVLAEDADILLLDEPTNHLDEEMILWLEDYLRAYRGVVLIVTHDRYFLDQVTNRILEVDDGKFYRYDTVSQFPGAESQERRNGVGFRTEEEECSPYGAGVGETGLSGEKHETAGETGTAGNVEKRESAGGGKDCGDCQNQHQDGKEDHRTASYFQRIR